MALLILFLVALILCTSTVSALGPVTKGYLISSATYRTTAKQCTGAATGTPYYYIYYPLGVCIPFGTSFVKYSASSESSSATMYSSTYTDSACATQTGTDNTQYNSLCSTRSDGTQSSQNTYSATVPDVLTTAVFTGYTITSAAYSTSDTKCANPISVQYFPNGVCLSEGASTGGVMYFADAAGNAWQKYYSDATCTEGVNYVRLLILTKEVCTLAGRSSTGASIYSANTYSATVSVSGGSTTVT